METLRSKESARSTNPMPINALRPEKTKNIVRKKTCCRHIGYSFRLAARVLYMNHPTDRITHTTAFVTPVVEHWLEPEIAQWVHHMKDRSDDPSHHERTPLPQSYISLHPLPIKTVLVDFCQIYKKYSKCVHVELYELQIVSKINRI